MNEVAAPANSPSLTPVKVFISHSLKDAASAGKLATVLRAKGFQVTHPDETIAPGENLALKIGRALRDAHSMVVLLSPDAMQSQLVRHEIEHAILSPRFRGRLIPVMLHKTDSYPWILRKLEVVPFDPDAIATRVRKTASGKFPVPRLVQPMLQSVA